MKKKSRIKVQHVLMKPSPPTTTALMCSHFYNVLAPKSHEMKSHQVRTHHIEPACLCSHLSLLNTPTLYKP